MKYEDLRNLNPQGHVKGHTFWTVCYEDSVLGTEMTAWFDSREEADDFIIACYVMDFKALPVRARTMHRVDSILESMDKCMWFEGR